MRVKIDRLSYIRERDYNYGRSRYDSNSDIGRRDDKWTRRDSSDHVRDKKSLSRERDQCPHRRCKRSRSSGHDDRQRSRSPQVCTRSRSHQDNYGKDRHNKSEGRRNRDDRQSHEHSSVTPTATVEVKGLSKQTTEENIHQILAEWRPFLHVRVMRRRKSSVCRGIAFIDFSSVSAAQKMMDVVGNCGLDVNGQKLSFEYRKTNDYGRKECVAVTSENIAAVPIVEELEIGNLQPDSSSDCISTSISQEDLEELMICIKKHPYLKSIVEDIEIGGPIVMMRYLNDSQVLYKLGQATGFGVSGEVDT
ncbi:hypothetical protein MKX03_034111 [Papaver bracteatum]|nr:hypothetical protein MKX03_034111 [Papaver bracteatum]